MRPIEATAALDASIFSIMAPRLSAFIIEKMSTISLGVNASMIGAALLGDIFAYILASCVI
ncbi:hypothetical protein D3C86_2245040 [compost metagenome]